MSELPLLCIRADAGPKIGAGHVMRCLALAQAWRARSGSALFVSRVDAPALDRRLRGEGFDVQAPATGSEAEDIRATIDHMAAAARTPGAPCWLALDGYSFSGAWQPAVRDAGHKLLLLDDTATLNSFNADILLNQNAFAHELQYDAPPRTLRLLGLDFTLLREEFLSRQRQPAASENATRILVTMGAADANDATSTVLKGLKLCRLERTDAALDVTVAVGPANPHRDRLERFAPQKPLAVDLVTPGQDMPERMTAADVCIAAAGSTSWELAHLGVPALLVTTADNQRGIAARLAAEGAAIDLGEANALSPEAVASALLPLLNDARRTDSMSRAGRRLVDGQGAGRVATLMAVLSGGGVDVAAHLRPANANDELPLWRIANAPDVRANSLSSNPIEWNDHVSWFRGKLCSKTTLFLILDVQRTLAGYIRFDVYGDAAVLSYALASPFRGLSLGAPLLRAGTSEAFRTLEVNCVEAKVLTSNVASVKCFHKAGFVSQGKEQLDGREFMVFSANRAAWQAVSHPATDPADRLQQGGVQ